MNKTIFPAILIALIASSAHAGNVTVQSAVLDVTGKYLVVDAVFGGAGKHSFELQQDECLESTVVQCQYKVIDSNTDNSEIAGVGKIVFPLAKYHLTGKRVRGGWISVSGKGSAEPGIEINFN